MKIKNTYIVNDNTRVIVMYETEDGRFFIPYSNDSSQITEISKTRAKALLNL